MTLGVDHGAKGLGHGLPLSIGHLRQSVVVHAEIAVVSFGPHLDVDGLVVPDTDVVMDGLLEPHRQRSSFHSENTRWVKLVCCIRTGFSSSSPSSFAIWAILSIWVRVHRRREAFFREP